MYILLDIKNKDLREFLAFIFERDGDTFVVSRTHNLGKLLCSTYRRSDLPVKYQVNESTVRLKLPIADSTKSADKSYIYYSREDMAAINDLLKVFFNIDFDSYYLKGKKLNLPQKEIIEAYLYTRFITTVGDKFEMLKKKQYRDEELILNKKRKSLRNRAFYLHEKIENSLLEIINDSITNS